MPATAMAIVASGLALQASEDAKQSHDSSMHHRLPLNQHTDCQTIHHNGHDLYYCEQITPYQWEAMKQAENKSDMLVIGALLIGIIVLIVIGIKLTN